MTRKDLEKQGKKDPEAVKRLQKDMTALIEAIQQSYTDKLVRIPQNVSMLPSWCVITQTTSMKLRPNDEFYSKVANFKQSPACTEENLRILIQQDWGRQQAGDLGKSTLELFLIILRETYPLLTSLRQLPPSSQSPCLHPFHFSQPQMLRRCLIL